MKNKIITILFCIYLFLMVCFNFFSNDNELSITEKRKLATKPEFNINNVMNGSYMNKMDTYITDQFVFREIFRNIKSSIQFDIFQMFDSNNIYIKDNHIFKIDNHTNKKNINSFVEKINNIQKNFTEKNNVYYSIIPDKNYYVKEDLFLKMDYDYLYKEIQKIKGTYIELRNLLSLNHYYETDTHWRQETLEEVIMKLGDIMNFESTFPQDKREYSNFFGVLYGQSATYRSPETLTYLINESILKSKVSYLENKNFDTVYIEKNLESLDSYNIFLDGATAFLEINNPLNRTNRELVIFRDSFASSLTPLLIESYSKITLIDLRYISSEYYSKLINWNNQDVLFLYSTSLVNSSNILKQ